MSDEGRLTDKPSRTQALRRDRDSSDLEAVLGTPEGKRFVLSVIGRCGLYRSAFTGDRGATDLRLGEQNIGLWLVSRMDRIGPTVFPQLLLEQARLADLENEELHVVDAE